MLDDGPSEERPKKWLIFIAGIFCLIAGIVGLVTPVLPGAILIVLAAALFAKSSRRIYNRLRDHRWFGKYVHQYEANHGISWKAKLIAIGYVLLTAAFNIFLLLRNTGATLKIASVAIALGTIALIIFFVPAAKK